MRSKLRRMTTKGVDNWGEELRMSRELVELSWLLTSEKNKFAKTSTLRYIHAWRLVSENASIQYNLIPHHLFTDSQYYRHLGFSSYDSCERRSQIA